MTNILECRKIKEDQLRLICYDEASSGLVKMPSELEGLTAQIDQKQEDIFATPKERKTPRSQEHSPSEKQNVHKDEGLIESFGKKQDKKKSTSLDGDKLISVVSSVKKLPSRKIQVTLENGQIWRQISTEKKNLPKVKDQVVIYPGSFGSFFMKVEGKKARIRVKRIS